MPSLNKVFLLGNLTRDPELRFTPSGASVCEFSIAVNREWGGKDGGEKKKEVGEVVKKIKSGEFKATPGKHCDWCAYREICPFAYKG